MKKFITTFLICLFLLFSVAINVVAIAIAETKVLTKGIYSIDSVKLLTGIKYKVRNDSEGNSFLMVIDNNQTIEQLLRLEPNSPEYILKPLKFGDILVVIGASNLEFY
jgi:hypothetical protein